MHIQQSNQQKSTQHVLGGDVVRHSREVALEHEEEGGEPDGINGPHRHHHQDAHAGAVLDASLCVHRPAQTHAFLRICRAFVLAYKCVCVCMPHSLFAHAPLVCLMPDACMHLMLGQGWLRLRK